MAVYLFFSLLGFLLVIVYCITLLKAQSKLKKGHQAVLDSLKKRSHFLSETNSALQKQVASIQDSEETIKNLNTALEAANLQRKAVEDQVRSLNGLDALTSLPNRVLFLDRLRQSLARVPFHNDHVGVYYLSVDHFKGINDVFGYHIGDLLLKAIGERLTLLLRPGDTVARIEGNVFAIICVDVAKSHDLTKIAQTILGVFSKPFFIEKHELYRTVSIGISIFPEDGESAETLLQHAETALSRTKSTGRNNWHYYSKEVNQSMLFRVEMENSLYHALKQNELKLHYQPKLDLVSNIVTGFEALVRWQHPRLGLVHPKEFIPLAEDAGLIIPIGEWVLQTACMQCKDWQQKYAPNLSMAVNLSARQFQGDHLENQIREALNRFDLHPSCLELELTETLDQSAPQTVEVITKLANMGVQIGIDDFGIGFSSLSYLKQLPISFIKIDQSFVSGIPADANDMAITTAIIQLGHSLHLKVIAEGVEDVDQMEFLKKLDCDLVQGYLIGKPALPAVIIESILEKNFYVS